MGKLTIFTSAILLVLGMEPNSQAETVAEHKLTVAASSQLHLTDQEVDKVIGEMNDLMTSSHYSWDAPCGTVRFKRGGAVVSNDDLLPTGTFDELAANLARFGQGANVLVVTGINCPGVSQAAGCGNVGQEPLVVGQFPGFDAQLWLHERGHNVGLQHSAENPAVDTNVAQNFGMRFMFWRLGVGHVGKTLAECEKFAGARLRSVDRVAKTVGLSTAEVDKVIPEGPPAGPRILNDTGTILSSGDTNSVGVGASSLPSDPLKDAAEAARRAGLTEAAFHVIGAPWVEELPLNEIKSLGPADLDSIRNLLHGVPNQYWSQGIQALAIAGSADDAKLIEHVMNLPSAAAPPGTVPSQSDIMQQRALLQTKFTAPAALGILANRTRSDIAVEALTRVADLSHAEALVGRASAKILSKNALSALIVANTPAANVFLDTTTDLHLPRLDPTPAIRRTDVLVAPLTQDDVKKLTETHRKINVLGIDSVLRPDG